MTAYSLLLQQPDIPITEKWLWLTDNLVSDDGTEQRISLAALPRRSWSYTYSLDDTTSINRFQATLFKKQSNFFSVPIWSDMIRLKQKVTVLDTSIYCNPARSDIRVGQTVLLVDGETYETGVVDSVASDHIVLTVGATHAYTTRGFIVPVIDSYVSTSTLTRNANNDTARASSQITEYGFTDPFVQVADTVSLTMFDSLPVLDKRPMGNDFEMKVITGSEVTEYGGQQSIRDRWTHSKFQFPQGYLWDRILAPEDQFYWKSFGDYARGGTNPFYVPRWRSDLPIHTEAVAAGTSVTIEGTEYSDHYFAAFKHIMFHLEDGTVHYATVSAVTPSGGNDVLTFSPALPAGTWTGQEIGLLLKCCIADDIIALQHYGPSTEVTLNLRTVPD